MIMSNEDVIVDHRLTELLFMGLGHAPDYRKCPITDGV